MARTNLPVSHSVHSTPGGAFARIASVLDGPLAEGWFVPTRVFNGEKHPHPMGKHMVSGFVLGEDRMAATKAAQRLLGVLEA